MYRAAVFFLLPLTALGQFAVGVRGGVPLTTSYSEFNDFFNGSGASGAAGTRRYVVGPMLRVSLPLGFGVEFNALYQRLGFDSISSHADVFNDTRVIANSWEFPILGSYRLHRHLYVAAGPSFRTTSISSLTATENFPGQVFPIPTPPGGLPGFPIGRRSGYGIAIGAGAEFRAGILRILPELRYTRWGADPSGQMPPASNPNQLQLLLGFALGSGK